MLIVESVNAEKKRFPLMVMKKLFLWYDIAMYTDDAEVPLYDVLEAIKEKEKSAQASIDPKRLLPNNCVNTWLKYYQTLIVNAYM